MIKNDDNSVTTEFHNAEQSVEAHSAVFRKELGLADLLLTQSLFIIGLSWVGAAAKLGPSQVVFWLLAIVLGNVQVHWPESNALIKRGVCDPECCIPDYNTTVEIEH